jgi:uncharacterized protein (TIGR03067 family)
MRRGISAAVVLALVGGGALGGNGDAVKKELKRLEGTWQFTKMVRDGEDTPAKEVESLQLVIAGDKLTVKNPKKDEVAQFTIDATKNPHFINIQPGGGAKLVEGIYKLVKDRLTICFIHDGGPRPKEFASPKKTRAVLTILERVKK